PLVLAGDYNVIPAPADAKRPQAWVNDALFLPRTRERFRALLNLGLTDALRASSDDGGLYTFWDYQAGAYQRDDGIRIDHLLLWPQAASPALASTATCAAGTSPPTTCRSMSISISPGGEFYRRSSKRRSLQCRR